MGSKFDKHIFLGALPNLLPTTPATTLEIWQNVYFVCGFDILIFLQKNDVLETIFRYGNFSIIKAKLDALFWSLSCNLEILGNIFIGALHSVP